MLVSLLAGSASAITSGATCDKKSATASTIELKWNMCMYSSEWGGYEVAGCTGVNPKLQLTRGTTYTFDQSDQSNWSARAARELPDPRTRPAAPEAR